MSESVMERATLAVVKVWQKSDNQVGAVLDCAAVARAVIEAMREPTDLQCEAARQQTWLGSAMAERVWQAMIDAALKWPAGSADRAGVPMAEDLRAAIHNPPFTTTVTMGEDMTESIESLRKRLEDLKGWRIDPGSSPAELGDKLLAVADLNLRIAECLLKLGSDTRSS